MKLLRAAETDLSSALRALSAKLSIRSGILSPQSEQKTIEVFGQPLTPQEVVRKIVAEVRERGDEAIAQYTQKLDGALLSPEMFAVTRDEMAAAYRSVPQRLKESLARAKENIWRFQEHIKLRPPPPPLPAASSAPPPSCQGLRQG